MAKNKIRESAGDRVFNAVILVIATCMLLIVLYPLWFVVICSFSDPNYVGAGEVWFWPKGFNIIGYTRVFQDPDIMTGYANTIFYTVTGTIINVFLTFLAGYAMSKRDLPGRSIFMTIMFITMYFGGGIIPTYLLVKSMHLINTRLIVLIIGAVSVYNLIICRTFFQGLPQELEEAAEIDGCSTFRVFWQIVLPLSKALMGVMVLYYGVAHWNSYFTEMIYLQDDSKKSLQLFLRRILVLEQQSEDMGAGSEELAAEAEKLKLLIKYSVIIVSAAPLLCIYPFLQKYFDKGVLLGSLKG